MNGKRKTQRTLTGSRIYLRSGRFYYFAPEPMLNPKTGRVVRWMGLCKEEDGELAARVELNKLLDRAGESKGRGDFVVWFGKWKTKFLADRADRAPKDPARAKIWATGTKAVASQLGVIGNGFADFDVAQIEAPDVAEFIDQWEGRRSAQSYKGYLKKFFAWAIRRGLAKTNPATAVTVEKPKARDVLMTPGQYLAIQDAATTLQNGKRTHAAEMLCCYMDLLYLMYQRGTDVRLLKRNELSGDYLAITPTKTEHSSEAAVGIKITDEIRAVVARATRVAPISSVYVICTRSGQPYSAHGIQARFEAACKKAGVSGVTLKDIRPMAATAAKRAGYTREQLKVALAHTDASTTDGYIREREVPLSDVVLTLPKLPSGI